MAFLIKINKVISPSSPQSVREAVPEELLPTLWGGSNTNTSCPDIEDSEFATIGLGGQVPLYYQTVQKHKDIPGGLLCLVTGSSSAQSWNHHCIWRYGGHQHPGHPAEVHLHPEIHHQAALHPALEVQV